MLGFRRPAPLEPEMPPEPEFYQHLSLELIDWTRAALEAVLRCPETTPKGGIYDALVRAYKRLDDLEFRLRRDHDLHG